MTKNLFRGKFIFNYLDCISWSTWAFPHEENPDKYNHPCLIEDISYVQNFCPSTIQRLRDTLADFIWCNRKTIMRAVKHDGYDIENIPVDFWLTRNRHGSNFWGRHISEDVSEKLTESARSYGEDSCFTYKKINNKIFIGDHLEMFNARSS